MKALLVHPGTQHAFQLARQLERFDSLRAFWTGFAYDPDGRVGRRIDGLPEWVQHRFSGRRLAGLPPGKLCTRPLIELRALNRIRMGQDEQRVMFDRNSDFQLEIPTSELANSDIIVGFDTASWLLADKARSLNRTFVLDRTTGHPLSFERVIHQLKEEFPQWMDGHAHCRLPELLAAEAAEHERAHRIVVGSSFTRRTLVDNGVPSEKILVAPLGVDLDAFSPTPRRRLERPLRFVFVGRLEPQKGLPLLLQVWQSLGSTHTELWLVGSSGGHASLIKPLPGLRVLGKLSRRELPGLLRQCDVLVFPSYFEGFGAVLLEAMAAGLPVIATEATGAPDVITNGVEGYVIPTGEAAALRDAIQRFMDSPNRLASMSKAARLCAERHSWDAFGDRWMEILSEAQDSQQAQHHPAAKDTKGSGAENIDVLVRPENAKALLVHPGTQYSFRLARQLERHRALDRFWTGIAYIPETPLGWSIRHLPFRIGRRLSNRCLEGVPSKRVCIQPIGEWWALQRLHAGGDDQTIMFDRNEAFQRGIPEKEIADSKIVIGFDTSSWILAEKVTAGGRKFILDRSIGHPMSFERLMPMLRERFPKWVDNVPARLPDLSRAEDAEHRLADRIVVPSSFALETLTENGVPAHKITIIPFGVDLVRFRPVQRPDTSRPLRFVFLGALSARKGVPLLLEAWHSLALLGAELWLVGSVNKSHSRLIPQMKGLRVIGKVPHTEIPELLRNCDVLVFPSYFEGLAQVQLEALAAGLPIIATHASGASDLITHDREGYIIPVGDVEALREAMLAFIKAPQRMPEMSRAARLCAERYSWDAYGNQWIGLLRQVAQPDKSLSSQRPRFRSEN